MFVRRRRSTLAEAIAKARQESGGVTVALYFGLYVNGAQLGYFEARRKEKRVPADRVCHYDVTVVHRGHESKVRDLEHHYDDGPWVLVVRGLEAAIQAERSP